MRQVLFFVVLAASLAGCATHTRQTSSEGSALPRDVIVVADPELIPQRDPSRYWSVRDFVQPRGLLQ